MFRSRRQIVNILAKSWVLVGFMGWSAQGFSYSKSLVLELLESGATVEAQGVHSQGSFQEFAQVGGESFLFNCHGHSKSFCLEMAKRGTPVILSGRDGSGWINEILLAGHVPAAIWTGGLSYTHLRQYAELGIFMRTQGQGLSSSVIEDIMNIGAQVEVGGGDFSTSRINKWLSINRGPDGITRPRVRVDCRNVSVRKCRNWVEQGHPVILHSNYSTNTVKQLAERGQSRVAVVANGMSHSLVKLLARFGAEIRFSHDEF